MDVVGDPDRRWDMTRASTMVEGNTMGTVDPGGSLLDEISWVHPDLIIHAAAINGTRNFYERPADVFLATAQGTINIAQAFARYGRGRLIYLSSSEVYGQAMTFPTREDAPLTIPDMGNPRYSYAAGKIAGEAAVTYLCAGKDTVIVRPHNIYGPGGSPDHVVVSLIDKIAAGGLLELDGDPRSVRTFCYVDDFVSAIEAIADAGAPPHVMNVGSYYTSSVWGLASTIEMLMDRPDREPISFTGVAQPIGSPFVRIPDLSRLAALGWEPKVSLVEGLKRTIAWRAGA
jgi:nucleoside-diphosphate-sugar epimerase